MSAPRGGAPQSYLQPPAAPAGKPPTPRPHEIMVAIYLWIASMVVDLVGSAIAFPSMHRELEDVLRTQWANTPELATVNTAVVATIALVVTVVLAVAIRAFLLIKLAGGRRWARTILAALGVFSVLGAVLYVRSAAPVDAALSVLDALLVASAVVYMFSEGAKAFFAR